MFDGVSGHPGLGLHMSFSSRGSVFLQNACFILPIFGIWRFLAARAIMKLSSNYNSTGAKQSFLVQIFGSKFPSAAILYLALSGLPFPLYLITNIAMVGINALTAPFRL